MRIGAQAIPGDSAGAPLAASLVERERELTAIATALAAAREGSGHAVILVGEAGVGKTRLLGEALAQARAGGFDCLRARGAELESGFAFGAMRQLLERPLAELGESSRAAALAGAAAPAAFLLGDAVPAQHPPRDARFAIVHAFYWLLARLAERRPLALLLDDFHWLDEPSAEALAYTIERLEDLRIAVVLTFRTGAPDPLGGLRRLGGSPAVRLMPVSALSEGGSRRVLADLLGSLGAQFTATAHRVTAGSPFLLRELALAVATEGIPTDVRGADRIARLAPATVADWALGRLELLPEDSRALARSLAILDEAELRILAAHAGLSLAAAATAVERLENAGLAAGSPVSFAHPVVRAALYERLPASVRELGHHRAAEVLSDRGAPATLVASQLMRCEPRGGPWAVGALRSAAAAAAAGGDPGEAAALLRRALAELDGASEPELMLELGMAEAALGEHPEAIAHLDTASGSSDEPVRLRARAGLAHSRYLSGDFRGAFTAVVEVLSEIEPGTGGRLEADLLMSLLMAGRAIPELVPEIPGWLDRPRVDPHGEVTAAELVRLQTSALDAFLRGRRGDARALAGDVAARLGATVPLSDVPTLLPGGVGFVLAGLGEHDRAAVVYERALEHAVGRGSPVETAEVLEARVSARWWRGNVGGCLADVEAIHSLAGREIDPAKLPMRMCQATMLVERGHLAAAERALRYPPELEDGLRGTWGWLALPFGRAATALARRDFRRASSEAVEAGCRLAAIEASSPEFLPWRPIAAAAVAGLGEGERALEHAGEELDAARVIGSPRATGVALTTLGAIEQSPDLLAEAARLLDPSGSRLAAAAARLELGACLRRRRRPRDARAPLRDALDIARVAGSSVIAARARAELEAAGGRPRRERTTGVDALTPRERQIAELAAAGLANPQIAERLFVTRKTVEAHLRSVFRKLGLRSRTELAGELEP